MKTALKVLLLLTCFWSVKSFAQIGPLPCGAVSSVTTWRQDFPYLIGQVVILNGVTYQSLTNGNLNQNPCTYSGTQWSNIVGTGMGPTFNLANYTTLGLAPSGKAYVIPSQITGSVTDAFQAIDAAGVTLPSAGGTIDATGLGTGTFTVTHQLTALNQPGKPVTLLLNSGTKFLINTSFATPTDTPAACAVPVGPGNSASQGSAIVVPGYNSFSGNFLVGPSARVWDVVCNGDFTGNQETLRLDGVVVQGNSAATVMGSLMHLAGVFTPTHVDNSGTYQCFAQCLRLDAGTTGTGGSALGDISFSNDHFSDTYGTGGTYPGSVVLMDALTSQGGLGNVNFFGGMIEGNGPHNALLVINGRGSVQVSGIGFFGTTFQTASATPSVANPNVDPIQLIDASQVLITNLRVAGNQSPTGQPNLVDISTTISAKVSYGININQIEAFTGDFTCLVHNTVESPATCETGYPTGSGDTTSANYTYGQVFPILRQTTYAPSGSCINGSLWGNSAGTTSATTNFQCVNNAWVGFSSGGGGGTPGGSNTQVQFNNSGSFGADATFTFNNSSKTLFVQNVSISGSLTTGPILNGVSYSQNYSGGTVDVRVNACLADAMALSNGNTTGICDASAETGIQNTAATITVGSSSGPPVTLYLPTEGQWRGNMTDGTSCTLNQFGNTSLIGKGPESGIGSQFVIGATAGSSLGCIFKTTPLGSQLNYIHDSNFSIVNVNGGPYTGHVTTGGIGANFVGPMYDSSTVDHVVVFDALDATAAKVSGFCCGAVFRNMSINGNYGSGVTPLVITNTSAFDMETLSVVHPGATKPIIQFTDSSSHTSNVNIHGLYMETSNSDTTTALLQNSGYGSINLSSVTAKAEVASDAATIMTSTNTTNTGITISGFNAVNGAGDFFYPVTVINNSFTSDIIKTDNTGAKGNLGYYASNASYADNVNGNNVNGNTITVNPAGTANSGANFNSGLLNICGSYYDGTNPQLGCGTIQTTLGTGTTPYQVTTFGITSPGGGQYNFPFSNFINGFTIQGFTSGAVQQAATPASGNYKVVWPPQNPLAGAGYFNCITVSSSECDVTWSAGGGGGSGAVTPQSFGAFGDAVSIANGCTTNGTTTVVCPAAPFVPGDVGKEIHIWGAGASGASFGATITVVTSNTTVTVNATPATNVTQNPTIFGHDDAAAIQSCWNTSSVNGVQCIMGTVTPNSFLTQAGYLVSSAGLTLPTHANITGNTFYGGTTIFGEFNGDLVSLPTSVVTVGAGQPIVGVNFANLELYMDPTLANTRGIHLNAAGGVFGPGGMYASTFSNIMVENSSKECLWMDGSVTGADLPNQVLTFNMFYCNLPNQMHTAAAINITGSTAQIIFQNGQINGSTTHSNEPNPLISLTGSGGKFPVDVKFIGYTCEVATTCLYFGPNTSNLHYDNGYMEQVDNALIADTSAQGFTFNGNYLPNVGNNGSGGGAVAQFLGGVTGAMHDNTTAGATPTVWATCSGATNVVLQSGNHSSNLQTSGCALSIAVSGGTQNANSCSADTNITMPGITTDSVVTVGYGPASEAGVAGWGTTGGMRILARPSATNTMSWHLCNPTPSNITYGAYTFKWGFTQQ